MFNARAKMLAAARAHLRAGESPVAVIGAQSLNPIWLVAVVVPVCVVVAAVLTSSILVGALVGAGGAALLQLACTYRTVVITDQRILVLARSRWSVGNVTGVVRELPRTTAVGEPRGLWFRTESLGEPLYIARAFYADVRRADAAGPPWAAPAV